MEYTLESDGNGGWIISQGRGSPQQIFSSVTITAPCAAENGSTYLHFLSATLTDNGDGTAILS